MIVKRASPQNIVSKDEYLFSNEYQREINRTRLLKLHYVFCTAEGFIISIFPPRVISRKRLSIADRVYVVKKVISRKLLCNLKNETYTFAFDQWTEGYFHWLLDFLPKILIAQKELSDVSLMLPVKFRNILYQDSLKVLGIKNIYFFEENKTVFLRTLIYPHSTTPTGNYNPEIIIKLRNLFHEHFLSISLQAHKRIYISRSKSAKRRLNNEKSIIKILKANKFEVVFTEELSLAEQLNMAANARIIISNHGAGLSNILFMKPGNFVMEIRHMNDAHNNCYFTLASAMNLKYYYFLAEPQEDRENIHTANLIVDPIRFQKELSEMLEHEVTERRQ
jgi:capsular polysaccharide biosynthesis protein